MRFCSKARAFMWAYYFIFASVCVCVRVECVNMHCEYAILTLYLWRILKCEFIAYCGKENQVSLLLLLLYFLCHK
jgi:hypothetical protein